jgi:protein-S-isoprenylcysteine O-methyltransferase Ste14
MWVASSGGLLLQSLALLLSFLSLSASAQEFTYEVEKRIVERLHYFLAEPVATNQVITNFRENGSFANDMEAADRNLFLALAYSFSRSFVYFGLEDGTSAG